MEGGPSFPCNVRRGQLNTETLLDCQAQSGPSEFSSNVSQRKAQESG